MRRMLLATAALLASATTALAAPAAVSVSVGPELQAKAEAKYGVADVNRLADELERDVARALARTGAYDDARIELTVVDATPNRPTFKQLSDRPGLSMQSFGLGGAEIAGRVIRADGSVAPLAYRRYETDIRWAAYTSTWDDAQQAFTAFAAKLGRGEQLASR